METNSGVSIEQKILQQCNALEALAANENVDGPWVGIACGTTSSILHHLPFSRYDKELPLFQLFARLSQICPGESTLFQNFARLTLMHLIDSTLFPRLREVLSSGLGLGSTPAFSVPQWWPGSNGTKNLQSITSPLDSRFDLESAVKSRAFELDLVIYTVTIILSQLEVLTKKPQPSWSCFTVLISIMLQSVAHRDLTTMVICQDETAMEVLYRLSVLPSPVPEQRYVTLLLELLMIRPSTLVQMSMVDQCSGAKRFLELHSQHQASAYAVASETPFQFILDVLNHNSGPSGYRNLTVGTCTSIASYKLEWLASKHDLNMIYDEFNKVSNVHSLLSVLTQFGCVTAHGLLANYDDQICSEKYIKSLNVFSRSALPPLAKPNYFFSEVKIAPTNETLDVLMKLDEIDESHRSLLRILKFLKVIINREVAQTDEEQCSGALAAKIYSRRIQPIYAFILLVLKCNEKLDQSSLVSQFTTATIFELLDELFLSMKLSLAWTTLFHFATDISYNVISTLRIWLTFLNALHARCRDDPCKELITDCLKKFANTFHAIRDREKLANNPYVSVAQGEIGVVPKSEYLFLYQTWARRKNELEEGATPKMGNHYGMGGRQQSVHVDRYGKDRV